MNLLLNQFRKDLQYIRWPLAAWLVLLAAASALLAPRVELALSGPDTLRLASVHRFLLYLVALGSWLLATRLVHADPPHGTTAFWLTRPIGAGRLLAAKVGLILLLFVLLPAGGQAATAMVNGLPGEIAWRIFFETTLVGLPFVLAVVVLAALTRDMARLAIVLVVASLAWTMTGLFLHWEAEEQMVAPDAGLVRLSASLVVIVVLAGGCLSVLAYQYRVRRPLRSLAGVIAAVALACGLGLLWSWNLFPAHHALGVASFDPRSVALSLSHLTFLPGDGSAEGSEARGDFLATGAPRRWVVVPLDMTTDRQGGSTPHAVRTRLLESPSGSFVMSFSVSAARAAGEAAGGRWLPDDEPPAPRRRDLASREIWFALPPGDAGRQPTIEGLQATATCAALLANVVASVPLIPGASARSDSLAVELREVVRPPSAGGVAPTQLRLRLARPRLLWPRRSPSFIFVVRNRQRNEFVLGVPLGTLVDQPPPGFDFVQVEHRDMTLASAQGTGLRLRNEWLRDADLLLVALEEQGTFSSRVALAQ